MNHLHKDNYYFAEHLLSIEKCSLNSTQKLVARPNIDLITVILHNLLVVVMIADVIFCSILWYYLLEQSDIFGINMS